MPRAWAEIEILRDLLVCHPFAGGEATPVYAVDTSVWPRCDAQCSPERGYYYHPSRHSAGQPIVAGWAYQFIAQLGFDLEHTFRYLKQSMGWTTPRVRHPEQVDRWTWLVVAAFTQLRLACPRVADLRLP